MPEHALIVQFFDYPGPELDPLHELEEALSNAIDAAGAGMYDGHELAIDDSDGRLYMYGPDADGLIAAVRPILQRCPFTAGALVTLRCGLPGNREVRFRLGADS